MDRKNLTVGKIVIENEIPDVLKELGKDIMALQLKYDIPLVIAASDGGDNAVSSFSGRALDLAPLLLNTVAKFREQASTPAWKAFSHCLVDIVLKED